MLKYLIIFVLARMFANGVNWHSSQVILKRLYDLQDDQFSVIRDYLELESKRIGDLKRVLLSISEWQANNAIQHNNILTNTNGLKLINRLYDNLLKTRDLVNNERSMEALRRFEKNRAISVHNMLLMYKSLRRLQKIYKIPAVEIATGRHNGRIIGDKLDACECYAMAELGAKEDDTYAVTDWAIQAYNKWLDGRPECVDIEKLHYFIKSASMFTGFDVETLSHFGELHHSKSGDKFTKYSSLMKNEMFVKDVVEQSDIFDIYDAFEHHKTFKDFRYLCRTGKSERPLTNYSKCRHQTKNSPYRILMPFKEEDISDDPYMKIYHDIIYDEEIQWIIEMAEKNLADAMYYINGMITTIDEKRLGQLKWFLGNENPIIFNKLNKRIETLTEFSTVTSEGYQTVNYGAGGHFSVHLDAFTDNKIKPNGNRLATVLFYLSNVDQDGYTVFPNINFVSSCRKGSALIWHNLYLNNGTIHGGTFHGGCPVLKGNKWIMTNGLYENGQKLMYDWRANKNIIIV